MLKIYALRTRLVAFFGILIIIIGCNPETPICIGFIAGTSGRVADLGVSGRDAAQLAVEHFNQGGGIGGRKVHLIIKDDRQTPRIARQVVKELADEGVAALIGPMTSSMAMAVAPLLNERRLLAISPTATTQALSGMDDYLIRVSSTTKEYATLSARYQIESGAMRRVSAAYDGDNRSFTESWLETFKTVFTAGGGDVIRAIEFKTNEKQTFMDIARNLLKASPDGVLIVANSMDSAMLCQQIRKIDSQIAITLADWGATERLMELGGRAVEGVTVVQTFDRNSQAPRYQAFRKEYIERYGREPGFPGVHTYDAVQVALTALRRRKSGESLKQTIRRIRQFEGLQGTFHLDEFGDAKRLGASISVVRNGKFAVVE